MQTGRIEYVNPTSRAMGRMTTILFRPFDIGKWFALGFSAWLATLLEGGGSGNGGGSDVGDPSGTGGAESPEEIFQPVIDYVQENLEWIIPMAIGGFILIAAIIVVLLWVSSRGKFMFLDNVVFNRALIAEPWRKFKDIGNSLFRWRLIFGIVATVIFVGMIGAAAYSLFITFDEVELQPGWIAGLIGAGLVILLLSIILAYIYMLLEDFVIPMMYKHSLPAGGAWRRVLSLHGARPGKFILYALWRMLLGIASLFVILVVILITCCIAACLMAIPYLGAVVALPITVFFRGLGPEFIRQFGDEYDLWEGSEDPFGFDPGTEPGSGPGELPMAPPVQ